ncbi:MAG: ATP-binding cassette domain-containing protein [Bdellovibrionota bacterium]|nr:ATP-binding cassette domain-containing protein [Bdellovibrionota bacterium]
MSKILEIKNLCYQYPLANSGFSNLSFDLKLGEFKLLLGKNGSGKSTLINLILGFRTPTSGEIKIENIPVRELKPHETNRFFYLSQLIDFPRTLTLRTYLDMIALSYPNYSKHLEEQLIKIFQVEPSSTMHQLSLGQRVRIQIIAAFASRAPLIIIDEITAVLDEVARENFSVLMQKTLATKKTAILMATNIAREISIPVTEIIQIDQEIPHAA